MNYRFAQRPDAAKLAALLAGAMLVIPFLQPRHLTPVRAFYDEWLAFALGIAALALSALRRAADQHGDGTLRIPAPAVWIGIFGSTLFVRALVAPSAYPQSAVVWGSYAIFAALMMSVGQDLAARLGREPVCDLMAAFLLAGAAANAIVGLVQVIGVPPALDPFIAHPAGVRITGNVGQANLYANYLALGQASLIHLYGRRTLPLTGALILGALLIVAAAFASSRASILYAVAFVVLGCLARRRTDDSSGRLATAAYIFAPAAALAQWLIPVLASAMGIQAEAIVRQGGPVQANSPLGDEAMGLRLTVWRTALQLFMASPWLGVGPDEFAGAAFDLGLPASLSGGLIWTTPHNLILQLLSETGLVGAVLALGGIAAWVRTSRAALSKDGEASMWWIYACVSIELLHSLVEYPLSYGHFLALTAFVMGVGLDGSGVRLGPRAQSIVFLVSVVGILFLASHLFDYLRFDLASPVAAGRSLAPNSEIDAERSRLEASSTGLLAPRAERWLFRALPLDSVDLAHKVAIGDRVLRGWPSGDVIARQSVFMAMSGREVEAAALFQKGVRTYGNGMRDLVATLLPDSQVRQRILAVVDP